MRVASSRITKPFCSGDRLGELVSIRKPRMRTLRPARFPIRKGGIFRPRIGSGAGSGKEIEGLRGGVLGYAAQTSPKIDTARAEKNPFRMETS